MYFMLLYFVQHLVTAYERLSKNRYHSCYYIVIAVHPPGILNVMAVHLVTITASSG